MKRLLKFLHTVGAVGLTGGMVCLLALLPIGAAAQGPAAALTIGRALAALARWVVMPSLVVTLISGLLAMVATRTYLDAGWVWIKAASGVLSFEGVLVYVVGPLEAAGDAGARLSSAGPAFGARSLLASESGALLTLTLVALANVALGVWRPRLVRLAEHSASSGREPTPAREGSGGAAG